MNPIDSGALSQGGKEMNLEETVPEEAEGRGMSDEVAKGETKDLPI
jgi:hypothetical protein